jgi:NAD/NADP transhydrogenase beta subunit
MEELERLDEQSKNLGNWRTGLIGGATGTSVASAVMAYQNFDLGSLLDKMDRCNVSLGQLGSSEAEMSAIPSIVDNADSELIHARVVLAACSQYDVSKMRSVENQQKTTAISSTIGMGVGAVGTVTSFIANLDSVRHGSKVPATKTRAEKADKDVAVTNVQTDREKITEKGLNLAANIASGATTVTSGISTGFSIATLATIDSLVGPAETCERAISG